jgi:hypothetical protein
MSSLVAKSKHCVPWAHNLAGPTCIPEAEVIHGSLTVSGACCCGGAAVCQQSQDFRHPDIEHAVVTPSIGPRDGFENEVAKMARDV